VCVCEREREREREQVLMLFLQVLGRALLSFRKWAFMSFKEVNL